MAFLSADNKVIIYNREDNLHSLRRPNLGQTIGFCLNANLTSNRNFDSMITDQKNE